MNDNLSLLETRTPKVIKKRNQRETASGAFRNLLKHQVLNAESEARAILQTARQTAAELVNSAQTQAATIRREAHQAGRAAAENELLESLLEIKEKRVEVLRTIEEDVLKLSVKLAEKIIGREISGENAGAARLEIVANALRAARQQEMLTVRVNAADLPPLERMRDEKVNTFGRAQLIDFVADQAVAAGGCIIESQSGTIDARVETQLRILENALLARASEDENN